MEVRAHRRNSHHISPSSKKELQIIISNIVLIYTCGGGSGYLDICQLNILQLYKFVYLYLFRHRFRSVLTLFLSYYYVGAATRTASLHSCGADKRMNNKQNKNIYNRINAR